MQSGEPYSLYEFYGAVGSIYFGDFPNLMNPVLGVKDPSAPRTPDRELGKIPRHWRQLHSHHRSHPDCHQLSCARRRKAFHTR